MKRHLVHIALMLFSVSAVMAQSAEFESPNDGASIAERIASAQPGDTIRMPAGVYREPTIVIEKPVVLIGEPGAIIRGRGDHELIDINAAGVTISGFALEKVDKTFMEDRAAIRVAGAADCRITDNTFADVFFGIYLARAERCEVSRNRLSAHLEKETSGGNAIHSWYSKSLTIADNQISGFRDGIYLEFTEDSFVSGNQSIDNLRYGLHFMFSDRCSYEHNLFSANRAGVAVMYGKHITMRGNTFRKAWGSSAYGLLLKEIKDGTVENNTFEGNSIGLLLESVDRTGFSGNKFRENGWAIKLMASATDNVFSKNLFVGNTLDLATNSRSSFSSFEGNYWDRYEGYDLDHDGFGDVAHRPVSLFSVLAEQHDSILYLYRSPLIDLLDAAERLIPVLTPTDLVDAHPVMRAEALQ
ncbi:MAG: nitrous oxide reductase family maturation protein NosD [Rhodothermales bacterium]